MGIFSVTIEVGDPQGRRFEAVDAMADTGAVTTMLPASMLRRLGVVPTMRQDFEYAGGERVTLEMGETRIRVEGRETTSWVIFREEGTEPLLGSYTLTGTLLGVDRGGRRLMPASEPLRL